jgi:hypothetical protein
MRAGFLATSLTIAVAAGCGSSTRGAADADAALLCAQAPAVDCSASSSLSLAGYCSLRSGIQSACNLCGPTTAGQGCALVVLGQGTHYTYLQILAIDTADVYVYDADGALVARLYWSPGGFTCGAGPADFDPSEADSLLTAAYSPGLNTMMCPVDGGAAP